MNLFSDFTTSCNIKPSHIFETAYKAHKIIKEKQSANILISGESGAGKTESTKLLLKQLVYLSNTNKNIEQQILQLNPLLEAFGNAETVLNNNSSRFAKFIFIIYLNTEIIGLKVSEYLLEKSRTVYQDDGERNFHIFYTVLFSDFAYKYSLDPNISYQYLAKQDRNFSIPQLDDICNALDMIGFSSDDQQNLFFMISLILNMGNIDFEEIGNDSVDIKQNSLSYVKLCADILGIDLEEFSDNLRSSLHVTRGELITRNFNLAKAIDVRNALAKALYGRMFGWIVNQLNCILAPVYFAKCACEIGILDIFGFENLQTNGFEQICINLANEQLQYFFNQHVIYLEQEEYHLEGITWTDIKYSDNSSLLDLFLQKPVGLFSLLDEECRFPQATDATLVSKLYSHLDTKYIIKSRETQENLSFGIKHYAGEILYYTAGWLEKNRDTLPEGIQGMLERAKNPMIARLFNASITRTGSLAFQQRTVSRKTKRSTAKKWRRSGAGIPKNTNQARRSTLASQFRVSLQIMLERVQKSIPIFVRCIRPNLKSLSDLFDDNYVLRQLVYSGIMETVAIRKTGFPIRYPYREFVQTYRYLCCKKVSENSEGAGCILSSAGVVGGRGGITKIFLTIKQKDLLDRKFRAVRTAATQIQKLVRGFLVRQRLKKYKKIQDEIVSRFLSSVISAGERFFSAISSTAMIKCTKQIVETRQQHSAVSASLESDEILEDDFSEAKLVYSGIGSNLTTKDQALQWFKDTQISEVQNADQDFHEWFHGFISRNVAADLLRGQPSGAFLLRVSQTRLGYVLTFNSERRVLHYLIQQTRSGKYIVVGEPRVHISLAALVDYHRKHSMSNDSTRLVVAVGQLANTDQPDYADLVEYADLQQVPSLRHPKMPAAVASNSSRPLSTPVTGSAIPKARHQIINRASDNTLSADDAVYHVDEDYSDDQAPTVPSRPSYLPATAVPPKLPARSYTQSTVNAVLTQQTPAKKKGFFGRKK